MFRLHAAVVVLVLGRDALSSTCPKQTPLLRKRCGIRIRWFSRHVIILPTASKELVSLRMDQSTQL